MMRAIGPNDLPRIRIVAAATATILWACLLYAFPHYFMVITTSAQFKTLVGWGVGFPFPLSLIYVRIAFELINAVPLLVVLSTVVGITGTSNLNRFSQGAIVGLITLLFGSMILHGGGEAVPQRLHPAFGTLSAYLLGSLPLFFGSLVAARIAQRSTTTRAAAKTT
jgi:hypothetical protein